VVAGANITYTINYSNTGNMNATGVVISDTIPVNTSFVSATGGGTLAAGVVTWNIGPLAVGASGSVQLVVAAVSPLANGTLITNGTYDIDSNETGPTAGAAITTTVSSAPVLTISKTDAPDPVAAGADITYTLSYANTGNMNATGVVITDTIPVNTSFVSATGGGTLAAGVVTWNLGALNAGVSGTVTLVVQVASPLANGTIITNGTYGVDSNETAPTAGAAITTTVSSAPVLSVTKTAVDDNGLPLFENDTVTYTITVTNSGNADATAVNLSDVIPANTTLVAGSLTSDDPTDVKVEGNPLTVAIGTLNGVGGADSDVVITFQVRLNAPLAGGVVISNQATVTANGGISVLSDDPSTVAAGDPTNLTVTSSAAALVMTETVSDLNNGSLNPGDTLEYTITITNSGFGGATGVVATDAVPANTTYVAGSITGTGADDTGVPNLVWNVGAVPSMTSVILTFRVTVDAAAPSGIVITNQGGLTANGGINRISDDPAANDGLESGNNLLDPADDDPTLTAPVYLGDVLQLSISADVAAARRGDFVLYTITIHNPTSVPVTNVTLSNTLPVGLSLVPGTLLLDDPPLLASAQPDPTPAIPLLIPIGTVGTGQTRTLTYRAVVTTGAVIGSLVNRVLAVDTLLLPLSAMASHDLPVIEDPEFDLGTIIGKVFDDKDGNGVQGIGEKGVGGVMVAMEDGVYAVTNANGMYHIAAVRPGNRLVKINVQTLPPNDGLTLPEAQTVTLTPGLLTKVNFGAKMKPPLTIHQGRPGTYGVAVAGEKAESEAEVVGNLEDMTAVVNGVQARLPKARVKMDVMSLERNLRIVNGRLEKPAVFKIAYPADRSLREWTFEIFDSQMRRIRGFRGSDLKTTEIVWDGKDAAGRLAQGGAIYQYQLTIEFNDGSLSKSPLRMFGVNRTNAISFELTGASFETNTAILNGTAGPVLNEIVSTLKRYPDEKVVVRGHTDSTGTPQWNAKLSLLRAEAVKAYLVAAGIDAEHLIVEGVGAADPVATNSTSVGRARNRRVEIKALLEDTERAKTYATGAVVAQQQVIVNGQTVPTEEDGSFRTVVDPNKDQGRVYVGIKTDDGGMAAATVNLPSITILQPTTDVKLEIGKREDVIKLMQPQATKDGPRYPTIKIPVRGRTEPGNQIVVDGEPIPVSATGLFETQLPLAVGENTFGVVAVAPNGYTSMVNLAVNLSGVDKKLDLIVVRKPVPQFSIELPPRGAVLSSPNLFVRGTAPKNATVTINRWRIPVAPNGTFAGTVRLPEGPSVVDVTVSMPNSTEGRVGVPVEVHSDYFFMVALGDATVNKITTEGRTPDKFRDDLYVDGRLALYLKGRIQGKYLITAALDTGDGRLSEIGSRLGDRDNTRFTRNLDPDAFYPVYGDGSRTVNDTNSQGRFYVLVEAPEGSFLWGNYNSGITGGEFASFNRSLYGGKATWRSLTKGKNGEPLGQALIFAAIPETKAAHDEFDGTGGSLYFLRNKEVVAGSEKVRLEVRDKITGIPVANLTRRNYVDYEIDYAEGRILFRTPVTSVVGSSTIISDALLNGNPVVVVVDYEYNDLSASPADVTTYGARVKQAVGDNVTVGATYVNEDRPAGAYTLQGGDVTLRAGNDTQMTAEFSQSENQATAGYTSDNGGLTFNPTSLAATGKPAQAYRFEFATGKRPARMTGYYRHIDQGFSSSFTTGVDESDQFGATATLQVGHAATLGLLLDDHDVKGKALTRTGTLQYQQTFGKFGATVETRYRDTDSVAPTDPDTSEGIGAIRFDYRPVPKLDLFTRYQTDFLQHTSDPLQPLAGKRQTAVGIDAQVSPRITARAELIATENGDGAQVGVTTKVDEKTVLYGTYTMSPDQAGAVTGLTTVGAATTLGDRTRLYTEEQFKSTERDLTTTNLVGLNTRFSDRFTTGVSFERTRQDGAGTNPDTVRQAASVSGSYAFPWLKIFSKFEIRHEARPSSGPPALPVDRDQWLTSNAVEVKLTRDLTFLGRYNYGVTKDNTLAIDQSIYREESIGLSFRPVAIDWVNFLVRYTLVRNLPPDSQTVVRDQKEDQVFSFQTVVDLHRRVSLTEKFAVRDRAVDQALLADLKSRMKLWINRFNYHLSDTWDAALEYRTLTQELVGDNQNDGFLFEVNRQFLGHLRLGVGYNFTDFTDNEFSANDYSAKGFFFRIQGKY
ncbi:MAG TPA: OmpA family protein, partial [Candidatus Polarisedimenticolia bacterium]|nr:OmpA family protein [Candidatus Polarisedimenticolia bacterium]